MYYMRKKVFYNTILNVTYLLQPKYIYICQTNNNKRITITVAIQIDLQI